MNAPDRNAQLELIDDLAGFFNDPLGFVWYAFPWGEPGPLQDEQGPDEWQVSVLSEISERLQDGAAAQEAIQIAIASGHGIGKSALLAWIILWFISTREFPQIPVTANTRTQLLTKTWRELAKWHRMSLVNHLFEWTATKFYHVDYPDTWFASAIPWSENAAEAFAGTHEKYVLVIYDEASRIPDTIWETTEGAMTTPGAMWLVCGNYTRNTGRFHECFGRFKHRWLRHQIDSRSARKADKKQIAKWVEDYGEDSDFVRVRVRGVAPRASSNQFIGQDLVDACRAYKAVGFEQQGKVLSLDVARFGDDQTVALLRQGRKVTILGKWRGLDLVQTAERFVEHIDLHNPVALVVDGDGLGAGVVDMLRSWGYGRKAGFLTEFHGAGSATQSNLYRNRRAEVWALMRDAMKHGIEIPNDPELEADLTGPEYFFSHQGEHDVIQLEAKEDMKSRGLASPDTGDALAMSYAVRPQALAEARVRVLQHAGQGSSLGEGAVAWMG